MGFKLVICPPNYQEHWPERLREEIPDVEAVSYTHLTLPTIYSVSISEVSVELHNQYTR